MNTDSLTQLFRSKSLSAKLLGVAIVFCIFLPSVFDAIDDDSLTVWQRAKQVVAAAGQTLVTVALAALPPEAIVGKAEPDKESEPDSPDDFSRV